jgi:hypothetical protein
MSTDWPVWEFGVRENWKCVSVETPEDPRRHMTIDITVVRRINALGESEGIEFETPEA